MIPGFLIAKKSNSLKNKLLISVNYGFGLIKATATFGDDIN